MRALSRHLLLSAGLVLASGAGLFATASNASAVTACDTSWANPGTGGGWNTAGDWTNGVPTASTVACLGSSTTPYQVVVLGGTNAAKGVLVGSGATLTLEGEEEDLDVALAVGSGGISNAGEIDLTSVNSSQDATLSVASGAALNNTVTGTLQADAGAGGNRFINGAVVNTGAFNVNTNVVMNAALSNTAGLSVGTVTVAANKLLYVPSLTNYTASTHTLKGGIYELSGTLAVPGLDVRVLNATVDLKTPAAELQNAPHTNALVHLATLSPSNINRLTLSGPLPVGPLSVGSRLQLNSGASVTSTDAITIGIQGRLQMVSGSTVKSANPLVNHGSIYGSGTINGSLQNPGFLVPQSNAAFDQLTVTGNYTQTKTGAIGVLWDGVFKTTPMHVNGTATLAGYLFLVAQDATAGNGLTLPLVSANKRTGTFAETSFVVLSDGARPLPVYSAKTVNLQATSTLQQDDIRVGYQGWAGVPDPGDQAYTRDSNTPGDAISYTFTGTSVDVDFNGGPDRGKAQVTIDGKSKGLLDMYAPALQGFNLKTYGGLKNVKHTVTVSVTGTKNPLSSDSIVSLISFRSNGIEHDLAAPAVNVVGWKKTTSAAASFGGYVSAAAAGKRVTVPFTGTGIDWVTQTCKACGKATVSIDGGAPTTVDLYSATTLNQVVEPFRNLAAGSHTLTINVLGTKRSAATGTSVVVDDFVVHP